MDTSPVDIQGAAVVSLPQAAPSALSEAGLPSSATVVDVTDRDIDELRRAIRDSNRIRLGVLGGSLVAIALILGISSRPAAPKAAPPAPKPVVAAPRPVIAPPPAPVEQRVAMAPVLVSPEPKVAKPAEPPPAAAKKKAAKVPARRK